MKNVLKIMLAQAYGTGAVLVTILFFYFWIKSPDHQAWFYIVPLAIVYVLYEIHVEPVRAAKIIIAKWKDDHNAVSSWRLEDKSRLLYYSFAAYPLLGIWFHFHPVQLSKDLTDTYNIRKFEEDLDEALEEADDGDIDGALKKMPDLLSFEVPRPSLIVSDAPERAVSEVFDRLIAKIQRAFDTNRIALRKEDVWITAIQSGDLGQTFDGTSAESAIRDSRKVMQDMEQHEAQLSQILNDLKRWKSEIDESDMTRSKKMSYLEDIQHSVSEDFICM